MPKPTTQLSVIIFWATLGIFSLFLQHLIITLSANYPTLPNSLKSFQLLSTFQLHNVGFIHVPTSNAHRNTSDSVMWQPRAINSTIPLVSSGDSFRRLNSSAVVECGIQLQISEPWRHVWHARSLTPKSSSISSVLDSPHPEPHPIIPYAEACRIPSSACAPAITLPLSFSLNSCYIKSIWFWLPLRSPTD